MRRVADDGLSDDLDDLMGQLKPFFKGAKNIVKDQEVIIKRGTFYYRAKIDEITQDAIYVFSIGKVPNYCFSKISYIPNKTSVS